MEILPQDMVNAIMWFIPQFHLVRVCRLVSKSWRSVVDRALCNIDVHIASPGYWEWCLERFLSQDDEMAGESDSDCERDPVLDPKDEAEQLMINRATLFAQQHSGVRSLTTKQFGSFHFLSRLTRLETLRLTMHSAWNQSLRETLPSLTRLRKLEISDCNYWHPPSHEMERYKNWGGSGVLTALTGLEDLSIKASATVWFHCENNMPHRLLQSLTNLRRLHVQDMQQSFGIGPWISRLNSLHTLELQNVNITGHDFNLVFTYGQHLRTLTVTALMMGPTDFGCALTNLERLRLVITDTSGLHKVKFPRSLKQLTLDFSHLSPVPSIDHFGAALPLNCSLTAVVIASARPLSNRRLTALVAREGARVSRSAKEPAIGCLRFSVETLSSFLASAKAREALMRGAVEPKPNAIPATLEGQHRSYTSADIPSSIQSAVDGGACTFAITGYDASHPQLLYSCYSCEEQGICMPCSQKCHNGHDLRPGAIVNDHCHCPTKERRCTCLPVVQPITFYLKMWPREKRGTEADLLKQLVDGPGSRVVSSKLTREDFVKPNVSYMSVGGGDDASDDDSSE